MDIRADKNDNLSPERAADLLGVSPRTVRRWIASGKLAGSVSPCATTRAAVDALRRQQQARTGDVLTAADKNGAQHEKRDLAERSINGEAIPSPGANVRSLEPPALASCGTTKGVGVSNRNGRAKALKRTLFPPRADAPGLRPPLKGRGL